MPVKFPKDTDRAYAAGILDGEGSICINKRVSTGTYYVSVRIGNTDLAMLCWLKGWWGGSICPIALAEKYKPAWIWSVTTQVAHRFLLDVLEFTQIKHRQVENALLFRQYVSKPGERIGKSNLAGQRKLADIGKALNNSGR